MAAKKHKDPLSKYTRSQLLRNRVKELLAHRPDPVTRNNHTSAYRFWKETSISRVIAYRVYDDPRYIPDAKILEVICETYGFEPGDVLVRDPLSADEETEDEPQTSEVFVSTTA